MDDTTWERYGALGGIWFFVLVLIGGIAVGVPPSRTDTAAEIAEYYADKDTALQVGAFLGAIGIIGLVWWFATLWKAMASAEGGMPRVSVIALVGFIISGIGATVGFTVDAGTAAAIDIAGEGSAIFFNISNICFGISALGNVILTAAVGGLVLRTGFLPKWVAYLSYLATVVALVATITIASDNDVFAVFGFLSFIVWGIWIVAIGVVNYRRLGSAAT